MAQSRALQMQGDGGNRPGRRGFQSAGKPFRDIRSCLVRVYCCGFHFAVDPERIRRIDFRAVTFLGKHQRAQAVFTHVRQNPRQRPGCPAGALPQFGDMLFALPGILNSMSPSR